MRDLLQHLQLNPETVLVIRGGDLLTREEELAEADEVEIRPVISGGAGRSVAKCKRCGHRARVEVPRANAAFCNDCFVRYVHGQVERAIDDHQMFAKSDRLLVCVSGGKDSLALWDILHTMGYDTTGYYISLGTGAEYTQESMQRCVEFAERLGLPLIVTDLAAEAGFTIAEMSRDTRRVPCSACGLAKRYLTNHTAHSLGFDALVTGHNLDDEAATLMGNTLHWQTEYIARQMPLLPATDSGFTRKAKPLYRVSERETAAYAIIRGIDYIVEECPLVAGNTQLRYKDALNDLEARSPGTKQQFLFGFLDKAAPLFRVAERPVMNACRECGEPTPGEICAFCRLRSEVARRKTSRAARQP
ncbi:MAG: TIGR00269 family protein [Actinomycetota bacterium]